MKRKIFGIAGTMVVLLAMGLVLSGCDNGTTDKGTYHLQWGALSFSYSTAQSYVKSEDIGASGTDWLLITGATATGYSEGFRDNVPANMWVANGDFDGSFAECLNFSSEGVGAPSGLKGSSSAVAANVPLMGIFSGGVGTVLFYITKN